MLAICESCRRLKLHFTIPTDGFREFTYIDSFHSFINYRRVSFGLVVYFYHNYSATYVYIITLTRDLWALDTVLDVVRVLFLVVSSSEPYLSRI